MIIPENDRLHFRRQPFAAVWQIIIKTVFEFLKGLWPFILVILIRQDKQSHFVDLALLFFAALTLVKALAEYYYYRFSISDQEVVVRQGIFSKKQVTLPLSRIQTVYTNQTWMQKILGITEVKFDSPGLETAEVTIQLDQEEATEILRLVATKRDAEDDSDPGTRFISSLNSRTLIRLGLTANHLNTLLILLGLMFSFLSNIRDVMEDQYDWFLDASTQQLLAADLLILVSGVLLVIFLAVLVSIVRTSFMFANFRISESTEGYLIKKGVFNITQQQVSHKKIQYLSWTTNWLRKRFPLFVFQFHNIGNALLPGKLHVKVPVNSQEVIRKLTERYSNLDETTLSDRNKIHTSYRIRKLIFSGILPALIIGVPLSFLIGVKALYTLILPIYSAVYYSMYQRKYAFSYNDDHIYINSGVFEDRFILLKWSKIQSVKIIQNLYQRRNGLSDLALSTAGGTIVVPYIPIELSRQIMNFSLFKIESEKQSWE